MKKIFIMALLAFISCTVTVVSFVVNDVTAYTKWVTTNRAQFDMDAHHKHDSDRNKVEHHKKYDKKDYDKKDSNKKDYDK